MTGSKETLCASCAHFHVCSLKETFLKAQVAVDNCIMSEETITDDGKPATKMTYIQNIEFIGPIQLKCKHYMKRNEVTTR